MKWRTVALVAVPLLALAGCDDPAEIRKSLAQCELSPRAKIEGSPRYDDDFLELCMQAKGFVLDRRITPRVMKLPCKEMSYPAIEAECYRSDNLASEMRTRLFSN